MAASGNISLTCFCGRSKHFYPKHCIWTRSLWTKCCTLLCVLLLPVLIFWRHVSVSNLDTFLKGKKGLASWVVSSCFWAWSYDTASSSYFSVWRLAAVPWHDALKPVYPHFLGEIPLAKGLFPSIALCSRCNVIILRPGAQDDLLCLTAIFFYFYYIFVTFLVSLSHFSLRRYNVKLPDYSLGYFLLIWIVSSSTTHMCCKSPYVFIRSVSKNKNHVLF